MSTPPLPNDDYQDKRLAKTICRIMYYCGLGDCWYEPMEKSKKKKYLYVIWCSISNLFLVSVVLFELLAFSADLSSAEMNDNIQLSIAHTTILLKFLIVCCKRTNIKKVLKKLLEDTRISLTVLTVAEAVKRTKNMILILFMTMFCCLLFVTVDAVRLHFKDGIPIRTLVTLWPRGSDVGVLADFTRFMIQVHWWYLINIMVASDGLCLIALIQLRYKFRTLQLYFKGLREELVRNEGRRSRAELDEDYQKAFVFGVKLHSETLWCARHIQNTLGNIYSIQVAQSIALLSMCLIKLVRQERSLTMLLANAAFISCMLALTGTYMMAAGDITHEASLVSTAMFNSGWELCIAGRRTRIPPLLVLAIQRSHVPVIMTAFGIYDLSYSNFISVLRSSYSFFAVMY